MSFDHFIFLSYRPILIASFHLIQFVSWPGIHKYIANSLCILFYSILWANMQYENDWNEDTTDWLHCTDNYWKRSNCWRDSFYVDSGRSRVCVDCRLQIQEGDLLRCRKLVKCHIPFFSVIDALSGMHVNMKHD